MNSTSNSLGWGPGESCIRIKLNRTRRVVNGYRETCWPEHIEKYPTSDRYYISIAFHSFGESCNLAIEGMLTVQKEIKRWRKGETI